MSNDREERVRQRAHEIWLREGQPEGHGPRHWIEAEGEIDAEDMAAKVTKPKAAAKPKAATKPKTTAKPAAKAAAPKAKPAKKPVK